MTTAVLLLLVGVLLHAILPTPRRGSRRRRLADAGITEGEDDGGGDGGD